MDSTRRFALGGRRHTAELLVINQLGHGRMVAANRTLCIAALLEYPKSHIQGIVEQQAPDQGIAFPYDQFDDLGSLDQPYNARQDS